MDSPEKTHQIQIALALQEFEKYKTYIANELVKNCTESFMTVDKLGKNWQKTFECTPEYIKSLKASTKSFLYTFPADNLNYCAPDFFKRLVHEICFYIASYVRRLDEIHKTNPMASDIFWYEMLFTEFFTSNNFVQGQIERYNKKYAFRLKQQEMSEQAKQKRVRRHVGEMQRVDDIDIMRVREAQIKNRKTPKTR